MRAGIETLDILGESGAYDRLESASAALEAGMVEAATAAGAGVTVNRVGSMMTAFFNPDPVRDFSGASRCDTERYGKLFHGMLSRGVHLAPSQFEAAFVSTAHTDAEIDATLEAARSTLKEL